MSKLPSSSSPSSLTSLTTVELGPWAEPVAIFLNPLLSTANWLTVNEAVYVATSPFKSEPLAELRELLWNTGVEFNDNAEESKIPWITSVTATLVKLTFPVFLTVMV